jgi:hypothetical protein
MAWGWIAAVPLLAGVVMAPPAVADESTYLHQLSGRWASLSDAQLLSAGYRACAMAQRANSSSAVDPLTKEFDISVSAASAIVAAAVVQLDC